MDTLGPVAGLESSREEPQAPLETRAGPEQELGLSGHLGQACHHLLLAMSNGLQSEKCFFSAELFNALMCSLSSLWKRIHTHTYTHTYFFTFSSFMVYRMLNTLLCAIQWDLVVVQPVYNSLHLLSPASRSILGR